MPCVAIGNAPICSTILDEDTNRFVHTPPLVNVFYLSYQAFARTCWLELNVSKACLLHKAHWFGEPDKPDSSWRVPVHYLVLLPGVVVVVLCPFSFRCCVLPDFNFLAASDLRHPDP